MAVGPVRVCQFSIERPPQSAAAVLMIKNKNLFYMEYAYLIKEYLIILYLGLFEIWLFSNEFS